MAAVLVVGSVAFASVRVAGIGQAGSAATRIFGVVGAASPGTRLRLSEAEKRASAAELAAHRRWLRWLRSPQAQAARIRSRTAFRDLSAAVAQRLLAREFGPELGSLASSPAASVAAAGRVLRYLNDYTAIVLDHHGRRLVERANVPLRTDGQPVDLQLEATGRGFASVHSPDGVSIAAQLSGGVSLAGGVSFTLAGQNASGRLAADNSIFYGDVDTDTDASVTPTAGGVDLSTVLRSQASPEILRYQVGLGAGETLVPSGQGAAIERGGQPMLLITPPTATDAQGSLVPVSMQVAGDSLVLTVKHRKRDVAYPILVDPQVNLTAQEPGWTFTNDWIMLEAGDHGSSRSTSGIARRLVWNSGSRRTRRHVLGRSGDSGGWCLFEGPQPGEIVVPSGPFNINACPHWANWWVGEWEWSSNTAGLGELTDLELGDITYTYDPATANPPGYQVDTNGDVPTTCTETDGTTGANGVPETMSWTGSDCGNQLSVSMSTAENEGGISGPATFTIGTMLATAPDLPPPPPTPPDPSFTAGGGPQNADTNWQSCSSGSDPVNCATGDLYTSRTDMSLADRDLPFAITRTYDAQNAVAQNGPGPFGYGWAASFSERLVFTTQTLTLCTSSCGGSPNPSGDTVLNSGTGWTIYQDPTGDIYEDLALATVDQANGSTIEFFDGGDTFPAVDPNVQATLTENGDGTYTYTLPDQQTETFNQSGQPLSETDRYGNTLTMAYDSSGNLTSITDATGRSITLIHNPNGTVSSATGPAGTVTYGYDSSGDLTSVTDLDGGVWSYQYDSSHRLISETDPLGNTITTAYDSSNRVISQTDAMGRQWSWSYPSSNETIVTNPDGDQVDEQFQNDQPVRVTRGYGTGSASTETLTYDNNQNLSLTTDADGNTWSYAYDSQGDRTYQRDPDGNVTTWTYDNDHDVTSMTDPEGNVSYYDYQNGALTSVSRSLVQSNQTQTTRYAYDSNGDVTSMTDPDGNTWQYGYDAYGDRTSSTAPGGEETTWTYDQNGYLTSMVAPDGNVSGANPAQYTTTFTNDAYGRPTQVVDGMGHTTEASYDLDGNEISSTDANGETTTYSYDADNELTRVTRPDKTSSSNGYDGDGHLTSQTNGAGKTTTYAYNAAGELVSTTDPDGRTTTDAYDPAGHLIGVTDPQGRTTTYGYDAAGQRTSVSYSDGKTPNVTYTYDADGHRLSMTDGTGTTTYQYDSLGRLTSETNGAGQQVTYGYDLDSNLTSLTYPNGKTVTRAYNSDGELASVTDWLGNTTTLTHDADTNLTSTTFPSSTGEIDSDTYDPADQLTSVSLGQGSSSLASFSYGRTATGQVQSVSASGIGPSSSSYSYTSVGQLSGDSGTSYGYDAADDLTQDASGAALSYDAANQLTGLSQGGQSISFGYDQNGNRTQSASPGVGSFSNTYDQADQLTSVSPTGLGAALAGGAGFSLWLGQDGLVSAAGANNDGQLGNGTTTSSSSPATVPGLAHVSAVAAGANHVLALRADGTVWAWGLNSAGQLGTGNTTTSTTPVPVSGLSGVTAIAAGTGGSHSLAVKSDGTVWAWGLNSSGQLGNGTTKNAKTPVQVKGLSGATQVAGGSTFSLALKSDGTVWAWGANKCGQLGDGNTTASKTPVQLSGLSGVIAIAAGACNGLALKSDGTVWAWGDDKYGELGNGATSTTPTTTPVQVSGLSGVSAISAGEYHGLALESGGTAWAWGENTNGQLGDGKTKGSPTPLQLTGATGVAAIGAGEYDTLLALAGGTVDSNGKNTTGQLGLGTTKAGLTPARVPSLAAVRALTGATYTYNGDGQRATSTSAGQTQTYAWDDSGQVPLLLIDGTTNYIYDDSGLPIEQISGSGTVLYYHHDQLGSTRALTTSAGAIAATYTYDAYGNLINQTGSADTPLRWAGQYQDPATGLYYLQARYYDPTTGQFLSRDPLESFTQQAYAYGDDDPINITDPLGLCGFGSIGDVLDCVNPVSSGNLAYQGAQALSNVTDGAINLPWLLTRPPVVDLGAGLVCANPFTDEACPFALAAAWSDETSSVVATGIETNWCDPGELAGEETVNTLLAGFGVLGIYTSDAAAAQGAPALAQTIIRGGPLAVQGLLDGAIISKGG